MVIYQEIFTVFDVMRAPVLVIIIVILIQDARQCSAADTAAKSEQGHAESHQPDSPSSGNIYDMLPGKCIDTERRSPRIRSSFSLKSEDSYHVWAPALLILGS
jgi:hypothetical protein